MRYFYDLYTQEVDMGLGSHPPHWVGSMESYFTPTPPPEKVSWPASVRHQAIPVFNVGKYYLRLTTKQAKMVWLCFKKG